MKNRVLIDLIALLSIALVGLVGYKLSPMLLPKSDVSVQPEAACDLNRSACGAQLPGNAKLVLELSPRPIPLVQTFNIAVRLDGLSADKVEIDFSGVDMSMGLNRPLLNADGNGAFSGTATLPVCVTGRMLWQAMVIVETKGQRIAVPFKFATGDTKAS